MTQITPCLWYDGKAEEAANFYVTLFPDSRVDNVVQAPSDSPGGPAGYPIVVEFTLAGQPYIGLNGGPQFPFTEAISFQVRTKDQAETDRLWNALIADGGEESACGWLKDRWGMSWQITPQRLLDLISDPDRARAKRAMDAMLKMRKIDLDTIERAAAGELVEAD